MVSCGERELRGERRSKDGRSLFVAAAPSFFIPLLLAGGVGAQSPQPEAGVSYLASSTLVEALPQRQGGVWSEEARAWAAAGPAFTVGVRLPVRPRIAVAASAVWQPTEVRVEDVGGTRTLESVSAVSGVVEARFEARPRLLLSGGVGAIAWSGGDTGLLTEGVDLSPLLRFGAGSTLPWGGHLLTLRGLAEYYQFDAPAVRAGGGDAARVLRYGVEVLFALGGSR